MDKFVRYMEEGYLTPFGEMFDIGITTAEAVSNYKKVFCLSIVEKRASLIMAMGRL